MVVVRPTVAPVLECRIDVAGQELTAHLPARTRALGLAEGDAVIVTVPADAVVLLPPEDSPS